MDGIDAPRFLDEESRLSWFRSIYRFIERRTKTVSVTSDYTIAHNVYWVRCDATSGAIAVTLPLSADWWGRHVGVIKTDASANAVTVTRSGSDLINGATIAVLSSRYAKALLGADGTTNWDLFFSPVYPAGVGAAGTILRSNGTDYAATTATRLNTLSVNQILYASSANVEGQSADLTWDGTTFSAAGMTVASNVVTAVGLTATGAVTSSSGSLLIGAANDLWGTATSNVQAVGTSATTIIQAPLDNNGTAIVYVNGRDGAGNSFFDTVIFSDLNNTVAVLHSTTTGGAPAARTYSVSVNALQLAMASGTCDVNVLAIEGAFPD